MADLWLAGRRDAVRQYNECDAVTTYLLWLRAARLAGLFSAEGHAVEEGRVEALLEHHAARGEAHLGAFLNRWRTLPPHPLREPRLLREPSGADAGATAAHADADVR